MIFGYLSRWEQEKCLFPAVFDEAMRFLQQDIKALEPGQHCIRGEDIYASVFHTRTEEEHLRKPEMHRDFADIHVPLEGREKLLVKPCPPLTEPLEDLFETRDVAFYTPDPTATPFYLQAGQYAICLPYQQHTPICAWDKPEDIFKVVLKIRASLFMKTI